MIIETMNLWDSVDGNFMPTLTGYILEPVLEENKKRGAVLLCPGGGYARRSPRDKQPMALKFNAAGYHAFILEYRVAPDKFPKPLFDISKAVSIIRENAKKWNVDENLIVPCGFSAGAHLAQMLGVFWSEEFIYSQTGIKKGTNKPNGLILTYPVVSSGKFAHRGSFNNLLGEDADEKMLELVSIEKQINKNMPPTFIWHTCMDKASPLENSLLLAEKLREHDIPIEMHIFPNGGHGFKIDTEEEEDLNSTLPDTKTWVELTVKWLKRLAEINSQNKNEKC